MMSGSSESSPVHKQPPTAKFSTSLSTIKRKRDDHEGQVTAAEDLAKRNEAKRAKQDDDENLDLGSGVNLAIGKLDSRLLADYVARKTKRFSPNLSLVEHENLHIPGNSSIAMSGQSC